MLMCIPSVMLLLAVCEPPVVVLGGFAEPDFKRSERRCSPAFEVSGKDPVLEGIFQKNALKK